MVKKTVAALALQDRILRLSVIPYGARILVGVSGGIDSTALLHLLFDLRHELALDIVVAHYDHALRKGSARDRVFVENMARELGLEYAWERNKARPPDGVSIEEFAREKRFDFFLRTAHSLKAAAVVLGHTQDDLAETVLMRLFRGASLAGLRSILYSRRITGVVFLRPMLEFNRRELEGLLRARRIPHVEDASNASDLFLRNRIRRSLLPYIAKNYAPAIKKKLAEMAILAAFDHEYIESEFMKKLPGVLRKASKGVVLSRQWYAALTPAFQYRVWREALRRIGAALEFENIDALVKAVSGPAGVRLSLKNNLVLELEGADILLYKNK